MEHVLEACAESADAAVAAARGGADRVELCADLALGGVTPDVRVLRDARERAAAELVVLVRPRGGGFVYDRGELLACRRGVELAREEGADGVALGVLASGGGIDVERTRDLVAHARPLDVTFHRAFDAAGDLDRALDALLELGVERVLTSGGAPTAEEGASTLARLVARAGGVLEVVLAGSVRPANAHALSAATGARELHFRALDAGETDVARAAARAAAMRRALRD